MPDSPVDRLVTLPEGTPALTLGWEAVRWAVQYLRQPNGKRAGQRFEFVDSQIRFFLWWYAVDENGEWLFRHGVRRLAKGSGKSPFAAVQSLVELCAPVRLKDFDPNVPGGCVGKPVDMPLVQIVATSEQQTANTMRMVRAFAPKGSKVVQAHHLDPGLTQYYMQPNGKLEAITSSSGSAEGAESSFVVADETEHWTPAKGGPKLAATLEDNLAKSGSRMLETCNAPEPGMGSVAEESYNAWIAQEEGRTRGRMRILYDARIAPPDVDLRDEKSLTKALDFVYDDAWWTDKRAILERIWDPRSLEAASRRKYLNQTVASDDKWLNNEERAHWKNMAHPEIVVPDESWIGLFFDGSKSRDSTALIGVDVDSGHVFTLDVWERPQGPAGRDWTVPVDAVEGAVAMAFDRWNIAAFFGDVREWESFVHVSWPEQYAGRLLIDAVPNGKSAAPIAWDMRSHVFDFGLAAEQAHAEIIEEAFTHDGDSRLTRHVYNAARKINRFNQVSIEKETPDSPEKIDAAVCMIGARMVRRLVLNSKEWQQKSRKGGGFAVFGPGGKARAHSRSGR